MANDININVKANTTQAKNALTQFKSGLNDVTQSLTGLNLGAMAGAGGLVILADGAKKAISAASDLSETQNKVSVVFKSSSKDIMNFGDNAAQALGMSKNAALSAAGTFGNLFVSMGMGTEQSSDMSQGIVKLAADLASFNNIDSATALEKLRAGLVGETEPLRTLGVNISAAAVKAKALEMGLKPVNGELTAAQKATASYKLILEQTTTAQGDFARTADGLANSQRIVNAELENASAEIGTALLPAWRDVVVGSNMVIRQLRINADMLRQGKTLWEVEAFNQRLYKMSTQEATAALNTYDQSSKDVIESGFLQAKMLTGTIIPATQTQTLVLGETTKGYIRYNEAASQAVAISMQNAQAVAVIDQNFKNMQVSAQNALDAIDNAKSAQAGFQQSFAQSVDAELKAKGLQGKALTDAEAIIDKKYGTELKWNTDVAAAAKALADKYANTGDLAAFASAMDTKALELQTENDKLAAGLDLINKQTAGLAYLTGQTWMIDVMYRIQGGVPAAPASTWTGKHLNDAGAAGGADFVVKPGYPNDSFNLGLTSGEHVVVTPANQVTNITHNWNYTGNATQQQINQSYQMARLTS